MASVAPDEGVAVKEKGISLVVIVGLVTLDILEINNFIVTLSNFTNFAIVKGAFIALLITITTANELP